MSKYYIRTVKHPILFKMEKAGYSLRDVCCALPVSTERFRTWIKDPLLIPGREMSRLAGLFGMPPEELYHDILRNNAQIDKAGKWYLEEIRQRVDQSSG